MKKINVIGAGFAGLTVALRLAQKGFAVEIYEQSSRVGGLLGTDQTEYGIAERAANALICTEKSSQLFSELNIEPSLALTTAKKRFLFRDHPKAWPLTFLETLSFVCRLPRIFLKGKSVLKPKTNETLEQWGNKNFGTAVTRFILGPAMQGVYGNDISGLSASLILSGLFSSKKKKTKYRGLLTGPKGMQDLVDQLQINLYRLGVKIHLNTTVNLNDLVGPVVISTSAFSASQLLKSSHPVLAQQLGRIQMSSLMSVTVFFAKEQKKYQGFGCLVPRGANLKALGLLMNSYIFKDRNRTYNETWIFGGVDQAQTLDLSENEILTLIAHERSRILGEVQSPIAVRINRWKNALPYYNTELEKVLAEINQNALPKNIYLHGNYLGGIGLSKILERSDDLAEKIASENV